MIAYLKLHVRKSLPDISLRISHNTHAFDLPRLREMLPQALLLCLEIKVTDEDTATCIVWRRMCNRVNADVAVENDVTVKFESFTGGRSGRKYDVGVESLLLLVELVGYECGFAGNLFREGDGAETHRGDFPSSGEVRFEDFVVRLLWVSYGDRTLVQWVCRGN